jgi:hypothetical protein
VAACRASSLTVVSDSSHEAVVVKVMSGICALSSISSIGRPLAEFDGNDVVSASDLGRRSHSFRRMRRNMVCNRCKPSSNSTISVLSQGIQIPDIHSQGQRDPK